ncbi:MAG: zeta toxin family protein [bacterium]|nr:zeta toxin family protein [bacterium]
MAGSPGAGKTESSRNLIKKFTKDSHSVLRIDPDDLRDKIPGYNGANSYLFMGAASILAEKIQDYALNNKQSFIFDGTLSKLDISKDNISRSLDRGRFVQIVYVYQDPLQAWDFVRAREKKDGRNVPRQAFIDQYFVARKNVNILKTEFLDRIKVDLVVKNIDGSDFNYRENIDVVDRYVSEKYTKDELENLIL